MEHLMGLLLNLSLLLPLLAAAVLWFAPLTRQQARAMALGVTLITLVIVTIVTSGYPATGLATDDFYAASEWNWLGGIGFAEMDIRYSVGLDGLGLWLYALSALLMVTAVLVSWEAVQQRAGLFYGFLLMLETGCLGVFCARDIILFYIFFEFTLIPLFFLIGIWGSEERRQAATKFFLYTLAGSVLTFLGLMAIVLLHWSHSGELTFSIQQLTSALQEGPLSLEYQRLIFLALLAGFAIKVPVFPFHTWLPLAHVQAPTAGSVLLAGVMLKIGTYGFLRFNIPMLPDATAYFMPWLLWLAVAGIIYGALVALVQWDMKRLIAYSSVSHLGFCMLGLFSLTRIGVQGAALQMVNHGISTGALFALVGMLYERYHTREIRQLAGLARKTPWLAFFMLLFTFSSIGLPGLNGFAGEFLVLLGIFERAWNSAPGALGGQLIVIATLAVSGVVLGAWYMLYLVQRLFFGKLQEPTQKDTETTAHVIQDLSWREFGALAPLAIFVFWIGLWPGFFLDRMDTTLNAIVDPAAAAISGEHQAALQKPVKRATEKSPVSQKTAQLHTRFPEISK
ncbi:MAG: NADH-quinone oxidoreductase subunit M, partial [Planctomycetaceae bacterium]|nr:NADH-quinone oxidoreductase subunit M [Planctomycetaceae bacterium]